jgi:hypothetical protein
VALDEALFQIVYEHKPANVRGTFYRAEVRGLVPKEEKAVRLVGRRLLKLRREGIIPYEWIVDESREVYGHHHYGGVSELAVDVSSLYRRDYWRHADEWVQIWIEKRALAGVISPIVADRWGLNLYVCAGQMSESFIYRGGCDIAHRDVPTTAYVLSDFDPGGKSIFNALAVGVKGCPGGLSRFTQGVPVEVRKLALDAHQVKAWNLPTRPAKKTDTRTRKFIAEHGDISVELDAIPPKDLRRLVNKAISRHMSPQTLAEWKAVEKEERQDIFARLSGGDDDDPFADDEAQEETP